MAERPHCFLFDNGSVKAASTLSLRRAAARMEALCGAKIQPVSLLHSSGVDPRDLGGVRAELLEPAINVWLTENPAGAAVLLPLFFGPSRALTEYVPERLAAIHQKHPDGIMVLADPLVDIRSVDTKIATALADAARKTIAENELEKPRVLLVDHGSPLYPVALVRNFLGDQVEKILGDEIAGFGVASMERRPGPDYAFNEPLLASALSRPPFNRGDVVVLLQFLSPGRHAGPDGDIAEICGEARRGAPALRTFLTDPIANDERVVETLIQRYEKAAQRIARLKAKN
ncbi:MAG TPA: cobalamin biosynthesis protein CbiX [Opitutaceae bacterium]|nr:cobalamin biosynthesis protein CbiX [Opitutaceae bacterium]